ncbi:hypothetical protein V8E36_009735 [Tilletia maclaganii]
MERFTYSTRNTALLNNLVGTTSGATPDEPSYTLASNYRQTSSTNTASSEALSSSQLPLSQSLREKRRADQIDDQAGSWTVFVGEIEHGHWWMGKWAGEDLLQLAKKDRSWHDFATRVVEAWSAGRMNIRPKAGETLILQLDHRAANPVNLELKQVSAQHATVIGTSIAHALSSLHHGKIHNYSVPSTPRSLTFTSSLPKSNYNPSSAGDWETASQATTQFSQLPEDATTEQFKAALKKRDDKIKDLRAQLKEAKKEGKSSQAHYRSLISTEKQKKSQVETKLAGGRTLNRTGFVPRSTATRPGFGDAGDTSPEEDSSDDERRKKPVKSAASSSQGTSAAAAPSSSQASAGRR